MSLQHLARHPPTWLRVALASLMLAFALNSIAHVTHRHEVTTASQLHTALCGYCISFDNMTPSPADRPLAIISTFVAQCLVAERTLVISVVTRTTAQPRAPPVFLN